LEKVDAVDNNYLKAKLSYIYVMATKKNPSDGKFYFNQLHSLRR